MADWFREGGVSMYGVLAVVSVVGPAIGLALLAAIGAWFSPGMRSVAQVGAVLVLIGSVLPALIGAAGWRLGMSQVEAALAAVDPSMREVLLMQGTAEAQVPLVFGGLASGALGMVAAMVVAVAFMAPRRDP